MRRRGVLGVASVALVVSGFLASGLVGTDRADAGVGGPFPDVPPNAWYAPAAHWASANGIMVGFPDGTFGPDEPALRRQVVAWFWRQAGSPAPAGPNPYSDVPDGAWYAAAATWAHEQGHVVGFPDGTFGPDEPARREQVAVWFWRHAGSPAPAGPNPYSDVPDGAWYAAAATWAHEQGHMVGFPDGTFRGGDTALRRQTAAWFWRRAGGPGVDRPNLVLVYTDDQTLESMRHMPQTRALIGDAGTTFTQAVANFPLCCPARATLLTGQYAHNNGVEDNNPPFGGWVAFDETNALPVWLDAAGYETSYIGKYLNGWGLDPGSSGVPPGWDRWFGLTVSGVEKGAAYGYYEYSVVDNGVLVPYGGADEDYQTDVFARRATDDIAAMSATGSPFFLAVSTLAPHTGHGRNGDTGPFAPAERHDDALDGVVAPQTPAIGEEDLSDKPEWITRKVEPLWPNWSPFIPLIYREYSETLLAVDDLVGGVVAELDRLGELDDTVFVFTSDNGWTFGEHKIIGRKIFPYEEIVRVPLLIRGPGFPAGTVRDQPVAHIDVVPTLLEAAGVSAPTPRDGEALQPFAADAGHRADRAMLIADGPQVLGRLHYEGVRTASHWYTEHGNNGSAAIEYYDLTTDPYQLTSRHDDPVTAAVRSHLAGVLDQLVGCAGVSCRVSA
ncbi:MAG: sulfatase-like hydrolase/transferase [Actinomycetota bacterium]